MWNLDKATLGRMTVTCLDSPGVGKTR
jgi:hypothetical protein